MQSQPRIRIKRVDDPPAAEDGAHFLRRNTGRFFWPYKGRSLWSTGRPIPSITTLLRLGSFF
jgi:hypothetical protein